MNIGDLLSAFCGRFGQDSKVFYFSTCLLRLVYSLMAVVFGVSVPQHIAILTGE